MNMNQASKTGGLIIVVLALTLAACKSSKDGSEIPPTRSGMPEVVLPAKPLNQLMQVARAFFQSRGYVETESRHAYELVFDKPAKPGDTKRGLRVGLRFEKEQKGAWRLTGIPMGVDDWHSDLETSRVLPKGKSQIQGFLIDIKAAAESGP